jgi:putative DNA primase/helicase
MSARAHSLHEAIEAFKDAIRAAGLNPPDVIEAGTLYRFPGRGKRNGNTAAWCRLFEDGRGGVFGDWSQELSETWQAKHAKAFTGAEREAFRHRCEQERCARQAEREHQQATARVKAARIWRDAKPEAGEHRYLRDKGVNANGIRTDGERLIVPMRDVEGTLHSLQFIPPNGKPKLFLEGGRVNGCLHWIGEPRDIVCVAEGYATAATIHAATGHTVAVAFSDGNLEKVARALRLKYPDARLILCADNDYRTPGNPGLRYATVAARAVNGLLAVPQFGDQRPEGVTDFNDLAKYRGLEAVHACIANAEALTQAEDQANRSALADDSEMFTRLAALSPIEYDRCREQEAKQLGVRVGTLDAEVLRLQPRSQSATETGAAVLFDEPESWPEPIDGGALLDAIAETLTRHAVLPAHADTAIALWIMLTYTHGAASVCPILALTSPEKRCGKTRVLSLLGRLCHRPLAASNITAAALFRAVEQWQPCLLIDEADTFLRQSDELRGIINGGHTRDIAYVIRTVGEEHEPRRFSTWSPKAIACIGDARDTIMDRSIVISMRRKLPTEVVTRLRYGDRYADLVSQCVRWAADHMDTLRSAEPAPPAGLNDRAADNWTPLLSIAEVAGGRWPDRAHEAARILSHGEAVEDTSTRVQLLADIHSIFEARGVDRIRSTELVDALADMEDRPWPEWKNAKPLTPTQLAQLLRPFGVVSGARREGGAVFKGYIRAKFDDAFSRYLPAQTVTRLQPAVQSHFYESKSGYTGTNVTASETPKTAPDKGCNRVTAGKGDGGTDAWIAPEFDVILNAPGAMPWHDQYPSNTTTIDGGTTIDSELWSMRI